MKLSELLKDSGVLCPAEIQNKELTGIEYDSRKIQSGNLFVCLTGEHTDGAVYAADAEFRGAAAVLAEESLSDLSVPVLHTEDSRRALSILAANFYGRPSQKLRMFGVTGTNGKTTVSYMVRAALEADGKTCGLVGTVGYHTGKRRLESGRTTPESRDLQELLSKMLEDGADCCSMEVSSHALDLGRVRNVRFDYGIFTNLTQDHMDFHKDWEAYYQAKKKLFYLAEKGACINTDDPAGARLLEELKKEYEENGRSLVSYSLKDRNADFFGEIANLGEKGSVLKIEKRGIELGEIEVRIPGRFMACNALAAAACCEVAGVPFYAVQKGIGALKGVPGRLERVPNDLGISIYIDFAHTPDAVEHVLEAANEMAGPDRRILTVFGCGGDRDREKRPMMGKAAGINSDYCIVTSDNPRNEKQEEISAAIEEGLYETDCSYESIPDRRQAIRRALELAEPGDFILLLGKGHEEGQTIGGSTVYFNDKETVLELLRDPALKDKTACGEDCFSAERI